MYRFKWRGREAGLFKSLYSPIGLAGFFCVLVCGVTAHAKKSLSSSLDLEVRSFFAQGQYDKFIELFPKDWASLKPIDLVYLSEAYRRTSKSLKRILVLEELEKRQSKNFRYPLQKALSYSKILDNKLTQEFIDPKLLAAATQNKTKDQKRQPSSLSKLDLSKYQKAMPEEYQKALSHFEKAIKLGPKYRVAYHELLKFYQRHENTYDAVTLLNDMKKTFGKKDEYIIGKLCVLYGERKEVSLTQKYCRKASKINPKNPQPLVLLAMQEYEYSEDDKAYLKDLENLEKKYPKFLKIKSLLGEAKLKEKNYNGAISYYNKVLKTSLEKEAYYPLAKSYLALGEMKKAKDYFKKSCLQKKKPEGLVESLEVASNKALLDRKPAQAQDFKKTLRFCKKIK